MMLAPGYHGSREGDERDHLSILATVAGTSPSTTLTLLHAIEVVVGGGGLAGLVALYKRIKALGYAEAQQADRDHKFDLVCKYVLPDEDGKGGLPEILHIVRPNGGDGLGDVPAMVTTMAGKLDDHIADSKKVHADLRRAGRNSQTRVAALEKRLPKP